jgi:excisionase family DNA binding protein
MTKGKTIKAEPITLEKADAKSFFTVEEAANELGLKPTVIRNYLSESKMVKYKFKTLTLLSTKEVEAWKERQKPRS